MSEILRLLDFADAHPSESLALATVVQTRGSTYRRPGARMLIAGSGETIGAVSGGCLERDVAEHARAVLADGQARLLAYDTRLTLGCNGVVEILVEKMAGANGEVLGALRKQMARREAGLLATAFSGSRLPLGSYALRAPCFPVEWEEGGAAILLAGRSAWRAFDDGQTEVFFGWVPPPIRLLVIGTGYDVVPLVRLAGELAWEVFIIGHPGDAGAYSGLPGVEEMSVSQPEELGARLRPDAFTAAVLMTHHFGRDLAFLHALLPLGLPYLGLLGPRKRREQLLIALAENGGALDSAALAALRSPVGLDLGGEAPEEIALSILAEVRAVLAGRAGAPLRESKVGIHDETPWTTAAAPCRTSLLPSALPA